MRPLMQLVGFRGRVSANVRLPGKDATIFWVDYKASCIRASTAAQSFLMSLGRWVTSTILYNFDRFVSHTSQGVPDVLKYGCCHASPADLTKGLKMSHFCWKTPETLQKFWDGFQAKMSGQTSMRIQLKCNLMRFQSQIQFLHNNFLFEYVSSTIQYKKVRHLGRPLLVHQLEFPARDGYDALSDFCNVVHKRQFSVEFTNIDLPSGNLRSLKSWRGI